MTTRSIRDRTSRRIVVHAAAAAAVTITLPVAQAQTTSPPAQVPAPQVVAQSAADELPPVIVQGATIDKPKVSPKPAPASVGGGGAGPAPQASKAKSAEQTGPASAAETSVDGNSAGAGAGQGLSQAGGVPIDRIGSPVTVVTGAELKAQEVRHAADAIRSLPGVHVARTGGPGALTQVRLRGAEGNHTLVLIDGVEVNDTSSGEFDFSDLLVEDIERIELIRGGQSGLYGSRAIGGVISITTKGGRGPLTLGLRAEGGGFRTREIAGRVSAGNERFHFAASAGLRAADGFNVAPQGNEDDPYRHSSFSLKTGALIADGLTVDMTLRRTAKLNDFDAFTGFLVPSTAVDAPNQIDQTNWLAGGRLNWDMLGGALSHSVFGNWTHGSLHSYDKTDPGIFDDSTYLNERFRFGYQGTVRFATGLALRHAVSGLVEQESERFTPNVFFADGLERKRERLAYAAEYRGEVLDLLFPTVSVRHEDNDRFADFTTWKAAVSLKLPEAGLRPHVSVGTAVALPGMFEQFGTVLGTFVGNPNLVPEESFGWDAGVEFTLLAGRAAVDVTYFQSDLTNEISGFGNSLINLAGVSERKGIEVAGRVSVMPGVVVGATYTYLDATEPSGQVEVRRPKHSGRIDLNYAFADGKGNLNVSAIYNGRSEDSTSINLPAPPFFSSGRIALDDYVLVNVAASYKVAKGVEFYGRVENALDANYQEVFGFETAGIAAYAGVRLTYEDPSTLHWADRK